MNNASQSKQKNSLARLIRHRLLVVVSLLVFALLFDSLVGIFVSNRQYNLGEQKVALLEGQNEILIAMLNQETGLRGYIVTNSPVFLEPFHSGRPQYLLAVQQFKNQAQSTQANDFSRTHTALAQMEALAHAWYSNYAEMQIKRMQAGHFAVARSIGTLSVGKGLFDQFRASVVQLQQAIDDDMSAIQLRTEEFNWFVLLIASLLSAIAMFILGHTFIKFVKVLLKDLNILKAATNQQGTGDLAVRVQELTYDELNKLGQTFNTVAEDLQQQQTALQLQRDRLVTINSTLEEANRVRSQFLATMSHELRTPLASIVGFSEMLLEDAVEADWDQQQRENLERILKNGEHLLGLISDVLDLSKIEAGRMIVNYSQVDVKELLTSVSEETQSLAITRDLVLRTEVEEGIDCLETNPTKLHQILLNLVSNALKFTEQGTVTLSARQVFLSDKGTEGVAFAVKDSGIGIAPDIEKHIFEAFYQADGSYTRKVGGTGLGLAIVSQLTELLGGTIAVESAAEQGSTFTVTLPLKAVHQYVAQDVPRLHPAQPQGAPEMPPTAHEFVSATLEERLDGAVQIDTTDGQHYMILAVEDNADVIVLIKAALQDTHYTVVAVQDPLTVLDLAQEMHPSAITLDVMMPRLNGWQLLHQLKDNPATASIPVIILSVLADQATGYVLGADEYVIKPFKKEALRNALEHVIQSKKGPSQASEREIQQVEK